MSETVLYKGNYFLQLKLVKSVANFWKNKRIKGTIAEYCRQKNKNLNIKSIYKENQSS